MGQIERMINWSRFNYSYARKQGELGARQKISIIYSQNITPTLSERLFFPFSFYLVHTHTHPYTWICVRVLAHVLFHYHKEVKAMHDPTYLSPHVDIIEQF